MNVSDSTKAMLLDSIKDLEADPCKFARSPGKNFTRKRKLDLQNFLLMLLSMEGDSIQEELYRYFGRSIDAPSKAAFYNQRRKIHDDALRNLLFTFNSKLQTKLFHEQY